MKASLPALLSGFVFALGLGVSGMTRPAKVVGFLDVAGPWDPSLAFVMVGAIGVHLILQRLIRRRSAPLFAPRFVLPERTTLDRRLVAGAILFGIGWGLSGVCPGPALTAIALGSFRMLAFVAAMLVGIAVFTAVDSHRRARPTDVTPTPVVPPAS